jgi:uncharacterized protein
VKIPVSQISPKGYHKELEIEDLVEQLQLNDFKLSSAPKAVVDIEKSSEKLNGRVEFSADFKVTCSRCAEEFDYHLEKLIKFKYKVDSINKIDISSMILEEIILNLPPKVLCRPDCRGLCLICGQNLNNGSCEHNLKQAAKEEESKKINNSN